MKTCALIPAFNVESRIRDVVLGIQEIIPTAIVIDDGSHDGTARIAQESGAIVLGHKTNQGKGAALKDGFRYAIDNNYDAVITVDGDGQHNPNDIYSLLSLASKADIIIGSRMTNPHMMPKPMLLTNKFLSLLTSIIIRQKIRDSQSGFRLIKTPVLQQVSLVTNHYEMETEQLIKAGHAGFTIKETPIKTIYYKTAPRSTVIVDTFRFIKLFLSPFLYFHH